MIKKLSAVQTIAIGFAMIILIGAVLLMLPISNKTGEVISFINALFTATSATCVTGLVVFDTWSQFTLFGQVVILILIQVGGLGFMTVMVLFSFVINKRIGLKERTFLSESISSLQIAGIVRLIKRALIGTATFELIGAIVLATRFCPVFGLRQGIWYGIFHSVSAFCNAGFDLMGAIKPFSSLTHFTHDVIVNVTIMTLIIVGGIGFVVWNDIRDKKLKFRTYHLHTKIMITATIVMIVSAAAMLLVSEWNASMAGMTIPQRVLAALFQSVTPRTAGFNTIDYSSMSSAGTLLTMALMFIGAGPGSTAGGIKITTFIVMLLATLAYSRGQEEINVFRRRLDPLQVRKAFCSAIFYFILALSGVMIMCLSQNLPLVKALFEALSAFGTVGLSLGITPELTVLSKVVIILLMYSGRIGSLTVILSASEKRSSALKEPIEKIVVG